MLNYYAAYRFYTLLLGALAIYRPLARRAPFWARQLLLILLSVGFLTLLANASLLWPVVTVYLVSVLSLAALLVRSAEGRRPWWLAAGCLAAVAVLVGYKYSEWLTDWAWFFSRHPAWHGVQWIGLSFLTFRAIDFLITVRADAEAQPGILRLLLSGCAYLLFFPAYVSGPINRFRDYQGEQAAGPTPMSLARIRTNLLRASLGVVKILFLGRLAYANATPNLDPGDGGPIGLALLAGSLYCYYLYFYFDFSGYCDVALSVADFFDVRLPENFNYPFLATGPGDFWNRWHISLSHWLRDMVFFRLLRWLMVRAPALPMFAASLASSFFTLLIMGAWHGDGVNWLLYGCYHGCAFTVESLYGWAMQRWCPGFYQSLLAKRWYWALRVALTFNYVAWGLLLTLPLHRLHMLLVAVILAS